jgi:uncharacterized protein involved in tolerance to divalent cations
MSADNVLVFTTLPNDADAAAFGRTLVEERLAACVNLLPLMDSVYRWEGRVERDSERQLIIKTSRARVSALWIGRMIGPRAFHAVEGPGISNRLLNREHLQRAHAFFEQYGGKAVVLGRFVPIVRTFVPFVAGAAQMTRTSFVFYNFVGALAWVVLCVGAGWLFGNVPVIKNNFSLVTIGIVAVSLLPMAVEFLRHRRRAINRAPGEGR